MFATPPLAMNAYTNVGIETGVEAADPHKLVMMLYDGALRAIHDARLHIVHQETAAKAEALTKAMEIISSGLQASLDIKAGGQLGERLDALYEYMCRRLLRANLDNNIEIIDEVGKLLGELRDAWAQIKPAVVENNSGRYTTALAGVA